MVLEEVGVKVSVTSDKKRDDVGKGVITIKKTCDVNYGRPLRDCT